MTPHYQKPDLQNRRDAAIIMHHFRNYLSLADIVHQLFFDGLSTDTSRKVLRRLVERGYLNRFPLFGNKHYFRLGTVAANRWGYPRTRTEKLGAQRLPYELGTLAYTCLDANPRKRLLPHELKRRYPWFPNALRQWAYFVEQTSLATVRVELAGNPQRIVSKLSQQLYRYARQPEFQQLIERGEFFFAVVTATEHQELALQHEAAEQALPVAIKTANYPELIRFI